MLTKKLKTDKYINTHYRADTQSLAKRNVTKISTAETTVSHYENMYQDYHTISANLCHIAEKNNTKTLGFVSPLPLSGTSTSTAFVSYLISASNSQPISYPSDNSSQVVFANNDVLVIDAQITNPSLHNKFNVPQAPGLIDFFPHLDNVSYKTNSGTIVTKIPQTNIRFISSGSRRQKHLTLDQVRILKDYISSVRTRYSYVLVDLPPVLNAAESAVLAGICDAVILVVESGKTKKRDIDSAMKKLNKQNVTLLGTILNRQKSHVPNWLQKLI
jgi:Mrp family chromosome partitioning ATPase